MRIDWITVAAQIANFLVLVWLLNRFLYNPIIRAMDRREQRIADQLKQVQHKKDEAEGEIRAYRQKQKELDGQRDRILAEARKEADDERESREKSARKEVELQKHEWLKQLATDRDVFRDEVRRHLTERFYELMRRALSDLADVELEDAIAVSFVRQLQSLDKKTTKTIGDACAQANGNAKVISRFEVSTDARHKIAKAIDQALGTNIKIEYVTDDRVICGIELMAGNQTVRWSISSFLDGFAESVDKQLDKVVGSRNADGEK